jgi:hypothetical protein
MDRRLEVEQLRRSIAMLARVPATPSAARMRSSSSPNSATSKAGSTTSSRRLRELADQPQMERAPHEAGGTAGPGS